MQERILSKAGKREEREPCSGLKGEGSAGDRVSGHEALIEISDRDYRSICWPCCALEEEGDSKPKP